MTARLRHAEDEAAAAIGPRHFRLETGDGFSFKSTIPHRFADPGRIATRVVWVITPPHY